MEYPDVAIICSRRDEGLSRRISDALRDQGLIVCDDQAVLSAARWEELLTTSHNACRVIVIIGSMESQASTWFLREVSPMIALGLRRRDPALIPVFIDDFEMPEALKKLNYLQGIRNTDRDLKDVLAEVVKAVHYWFSRSRVFVCHSSDDRHRVEKILDDINRLDPTWDYWYDSDAVPAGVDIKVGIEAGLSRADGMLIFRSRSLVKKAQTSEYVKLELELSAEREQSRLAAESFAIQVFLEDCSAFDRRELSWLEDCPVVDFADGRDESVSQLFDLIQDHFAG